MRNIALKTFPLKHVSADTTSVRCVVWRSLVPIGQTYRDPRKDTKQGTSRPWINYSLTSCTLQQIPPVSLENGQHPFDIWCCCCTSRTERPQIWPWQDGLETHNVWLGFINSMHAGTPSLVDILHYESVRKKILKRD